MICGCCYVGSWNEVLSLVRFRSGAVVDSWRFRVGMSWWLLKITTPFLGPGGWAIRFRSGAVVNLLKITPFPGPGDGQKC